MEEKLQLKQNNLNDGIIVINEEITDALAMKIYSDVQYLERNGISPIKVVINSPGGNVAAGLAIIDLMRATSLTVQTIVYGQACSMAAVLAATAASEGERYAYSHSEFLLHQILGSCSGQYADVEIQVEHMKRTKDSLYNLIATRTKKSIEELTKFFDRDFWLSAEEAKDFGLVDKIL